MQRKNLYNTLKLSYSPLSNYDFAHLKEEAFLKDCLQESSLYIIAQRPVLTFEDLRVDHTKRNFPVLHFQIRQKGHDQVLECSLPCKQVAFDSLNCKKILLNHHTDYAFQHERQQGPPFHHLRDFLLSFDDAELGAWFSPEKFLFDYWKEHISAAIKGNIRDFLRYRIHYVGKATDDNVLKRLTRHEHLQDIISVEFPFSYGSLPTDEIVILFFEFADNIYMNLYGGDEQDENDDTDYEEMIGYMIHGNMPTLPTKDIYLDAEKAFIHGLRPKHNKIFYKNYPLSKDGISKYGMDFYTYSFTDPISLVYDQGTLQGGPSIFGDMLAIQKGDTLSILSSKKP